MALLLALVIALPPVLLLLGLVLGASGAWWWWVRRSRQHGPLSLCDSSQAAAAAAAAMADVLEAADPSATSTDQRASKGGELALLPPGIHIVASCASLKPSSRSAHSSNSFLPLGPRLAVPSQPSAARQPAAGTGLHCPAALQAPRSPDVHAVAAATQLADLAGGSDSASPVGRESDRVLRPAWGGHRKTASMDLGQLVRGGPSVLSQVMDDWDARSTLYRIMSLDAFNLPSPQQQHAAAAAGLLSPAAAALFSPVAGAAAGVSAGPPPLVGMPSGEVHMDEIDLLECIGKGGYGCVYKGSWRGAGVAVKYIVCPTDDADSLGRAIREVVLSKKMSHPNVVQCYAWTVLTEPEPCSRSATPGSASGISSPLNQSFTSRRQGRLTGRASLELLRPTSAGDAPARARRGLDLRFSTVGGGSGGCRAGGTPRAGCSPSLQRITERPTQEGRALQAEVEGALDAAELAALREADRADDFVCPAEAAAVDATVCSMVLLHPQATSPLAEELLAEAAEEHQRQSTGSGGAGQEESPDPPAAASFASSKQLKLLLQMPPSSRSPSSSPGIQAVHAPGQNLACGGATATPEAEAQAAPGSPSAAHSPDQRCADARSVEPASLPQSPFASVPAHVAPHFCSYSVEDGPQYAPHPPPPPLTASASVPAGDAAAAAAALAGRASFEGVQGDEQGPHGQFGSYEEMVQHFRRLAAEGQQHSEQPLPEQPRQEPEGEGGPWAAGEAAEAHRLGGLRAEGDACAVTAASSFSDVLNVSGFMLEGTGSGAELAAVSLPSSPRHGNASSHLHSRQSCWLQPSTIPSADSSRPATPLAGTAGSLSRLAWSASAAALAGTAGSLPTCEQLTACMPSPAWPAPASAVGGAALGSQAAPAATGSGAEPQLLWGTSDSVRPLVGETATLEGAWPRGTGAAPDGSTCAQEQPRCGRGQRLEEEELEQWGQPAQQLEQLQGRLPDSFSSQAAPAADTSLRCGPRVLPGSAAAERHSSNVSLSLWRTPGTTTEGSGNRVVFTAWQSPASPFKQQEEVSMAADTAALQLLAGSRAIGGVTPRLASLAIPVPAAHSLPLTEGTPQVTPRQHSLLGCSPRSQLSPRADSLRGVCVRSSGRRRVEELREQAAAALGGGCGDGLASPDCLSLGSHQDSFNSEEGFGSPVKQRCGGVKDVFQLEELQLSGQDALMVVVMEYCDLGSLHKALKRKAFRPSAKWPFQTTYRALLRTAQEVAKGMGYIHEFNIVHGDLKPGNVLLKTHKADRRGYIAKVSDFGLSRPLDLEDTHATLGSALGTIAYSAPETFADNQVKKPSDVYAFGIMLWEMFYCRDPYDGLLEGQICVGVTDGSLRPEFDDECPEPYRRLAERCWHQDPGLRPSFEEVDRELVRIEMDFRLHRHRAASKRGSSASAGASRPGSPQVAPRAGSARQFQASTLAG